MAKVVELEASMHGVLSNEDLEELQRILKILHIKGSYSLLSKPK